MTRVNEAVTPSISALLEERSGPLGEKECRALVDAIGNWRIRALPRFTTGVRS